MAMSPATGLFSSSRECEPSIEELMAEAEARRSYLSGAPEETQDPDPYDTTGGQDQMRGQDAEMTPGEARSVLGVSETATREELRAAFHEQMKKYHPDRVHDLGEEFRQIAEQKSKLINRAYEILVA